MKKTTIIQSLATVTILASMAMPIMVQAQERGQVSDEVAQTFFQRTLHKIILF